MHLQLQVRLQSKCKCKYSYGTEIKMAGGGEWVVDGWFGSAFYSPKVCCAARAREDTHEQTGRAGG